jgi:CheY-like chemotaxis protein
MKSNRVLIVDDDSDFAEEVSELLRTAGYKTLIAKDHEEAVLRLREDKPDIIMMDVKYEGNGIQTVREIREDPDIMNVPIIVIRGSSDEKLMGKIEDEPMVTEVLDKTILPLEFIAAIEKNLNGLGSNGS